MYCHFQAGTHSICHNTFIRPNSPIPEPIVFTDAASTEIRLGLLGPRNREPLDNWDNVADVAWRAGEPRTIWDMTNRTWQRATLKFTEESTSIWNSVTFSEVEMNQHIEGDYSARKTTAMSWPWTSCKYRTSLGLQISRRLKWYCKSNHIEDHRIIEVQKQGWKQDAFATSSKHLTAHLCRIKILPAVCTAVASKGHWDRLTTDN